MSDLLNSIQYYFGINNTNPSNIEPQNKVPAKSICDYNIHELNAGGKVVYDKYASICKLQGLFGDNTDSIPPVVAQSKADAQEWVDINHNGCQAKMGRAQLMDLQVFDINCSK